MTFPVFETERLHLIQIGQHHAGQLYDILSRDEVTRFYGMDSLASPVEAEELVRAFQTTFELERGIRWGLLHKESGDFIGTIGLNNLNKRAKKSEIGYELHPDYWRKGLTAEAIEEVLAYAFKELAIFRMGAVTYPENEASSRLLKKLGFQEEGRLRGYLYQGGESHDALVFSILQTEWQENKT